MTSKHKKLNTAQFYFLTIANIIFLHGDITIAFKPQQYHYLLYSILVEMLAFRKL